MQGLIKKKLAKPIAAICAVLTLFSAFPVMASADYYLTGNVLNKQSIPDAYNVSKVLLCTDGQKITLRNPKDVYVDKRDYVYIADTGNNRIIELDRNLDFVRQYPKQDANQKAALNNPQGIYVDDDGDVYVADTDNNRIVHLSADGGFVEEFTQPVSPMYDKSYGFKPTKLAISKFGIMYVLNNMDYHGIITLSPKGEFTGYIGTVKTKFNFETYITRLVATKQQMEQIAKDVPPYYTNLTLANDGTIYASDVFETGNQLKRLTPAGNDVYAGKVFGETNTQKEFNGLPDFQDIAVNGDGVVFAADSITGKLYIYDQDGNNISVSGGKGSSELNFQNISSVAMDSKNRLYVLDSTMCALQVLEPTDFLKNVLSGVTLYNDGKYDDALVPMNNVLKIDDSYKFAQVGDAKSRLREGENQQALKMYVKAMDKAGYSEAFVKIRMQNFRSYFGLIVLIILASVIMLYFLLKTLYRYAKKLSNSSSPEMNRFGVRFYMELAVLVFFHPIDAFYRIKVNRKALKIWPIVLLFVLIAAEKIAFHGIIHFPLSPDSLDVDYVHDILIFFVPLISWMTVSFAITSISNGKQTFLESATCSALSFAPFALLYLPITAISNLCALDEAGLYFGMQSALMLWCLLLLFCNLKVSNEYSFKDAVFNVFKILFAILCVWLIAFLFYIVVSQFLAFVKEVANEAVYLFKK